MTFSPALLLKTEIRGHSENLTKHKVIMLLSYRERLISINHKDSSARGRKNDHVVLSPKSTRKHGVKNENSRVRKTCLRMCATTDELNELREVR